MASKEKLSPREALDLLADWIVLHADHPSCKHAANQALDVLGRAAGLAERPACRWDVWVPKQGRRAGR